jgi:hypothetical protein
MDCLARILEIEQSRSLWDWRVRGVHLWPLIRYQVIRDLRDHQLQYQPTLASVDRTQLLRTRRWLKLSRSLGRLRRMKKPEYGCLYIINRQDRNIDPKTGRLSQLLYDPYLQQTPNPLIIETSWPGDPEVKDLHNAPDTISEHLLWLRWGIGARLHRLSRAEHEKIDAFMQQITDLMISNDQLARFVSFLVQFVKCKQRVDLLIQRHLQNALEHRVAFVHCASYLGFRCLWTAALHDAGFRIVELQHGLITSEHLAYNYPPDAITDPKHPMRRYLPDDLLVFGPQFSQSVCFPAKKICVGPPYHSMIQQLQQSTQTKQDQILVISQGTVTDQMVTLTKDLARALPDHTILFKLHPLEIPFKSRYASLNSIPNVQVRQGENIFGLIAQCPVIVSWYSTTLFEALLFENKRIFHFEHKEVPPGLGDVFENAERLLKLIKQPDRGHSTLDPADYWADDWQENFKSFLAEHGFQP